MNKIRELSEQIENSIGIERIELRLELAYFCRIQDPQLSTRQALSAYSESINLSADKEELRSIYLICTAALYNEDFKDQEKWIDLLIDRGIELAHNPSVGRAYVMKSRWSVREGKHLEAASFLVKALEFFDPEKNISDIASCYNGLGNIHNELDDYDTALNYFKKAMPYARKLSRNSHNIVKQNIALILVRKKEYAPAWKIFYHILDKLDEKENDTKRVVLLNLGHICQKTNELEEALNYMDEAILLSRKSYPSHYIIRPLCNRSLLLAELSKFSESETGLKEAEDIAEKAENKNDLVEVYYGYSDLYEKWDKPQKQVSYLKKIITLEKEIFQGNQKEKISEFESQHHVNMYKDKITLLEKKNKLIQEQNAKVKEQLKEFTFKSDEVQNELKEFLYRIDFNGELEELKSLQLAFREIILNISHIWHQPLNLVDMLLEDIASICEEDEPTIKLVKDKTAMIKMQITSLQDNLMSFRDLFMQRRSELFSIKNALERTLELLNISLDESKIKINNDIKYDFKLSGESFEIKMFLFNLTKYIAEQFLISKTESPALSIKTYATDSANVLQLTMNAVFSSDSNDIFSIHTTESDDIHALGYNIFGQCIREHYNGKIGMIITEHQTCIELTFPKN